MFDVTDLASGVDLQAELNKVRKELIELRGKYEDVVLGLEQLDSAKVLGFLQERGYRVMEELSEIIFVIDEEVYSFYSDDLPMVTIGKRYSLDKEDADDFREAVQLMNETCKMVKAFVSEEGDGMAFYVTSIETDSRHFVNCFDRYIEVLNNAVEAARYFYARILDERRTRKFNVGPNLNKKS